MARTKAYTLNRLIAEVSNLNSREVTNFRTFAENISPVRGVWSAKIEILNVFLNGKLEAVTHNSSYGKTVKTRVLKALRARKRYGSDFTV